MSGAGALSRRWFLTGGAGGAGGGRVVAVSDTCLARAGIVCQTCGDACPERAIRFPLRRGGPPLPTTDEDRCTGCGACVPVCPTGALGLAKGRA